MTTATMSRRRKRRRGSSYGSGRSRVSGGCSARGPDWWLGFWLAKAQKSTFSKIRGHSSQDNFASQGGATPAPAEEEAHVVYQPVGSIGAQSFRKLGILQESGNFTALQGSTCLNLGLPAAISAASPRHERSRCFNPGRATRPFTCTSCCEAPTREGGEVFPWGSMLRCSAEQLMFCPMSSERSSRRGLRRGRPKFRSQVWTLAHKAGRPVAGLHDKFVPPLGGCSSLG